jgi:hypothetical protein
MSRGWESKSVESQQAETFVTPDAAPASPAQHKANIVEMRGNIAADAERKRQRQALELQRERILSERTSNPHRRTALATALADIEERLAELGWTIHL